MRRFFAFTSILWLQVMTPALAADDRALCDTAKGDEAINACSRMLASGQERGRALAVVYRNRCAAWNDKREADRALADCNEAIRTDSGYAAAYVERGLARRLKRDQDRAMADYVEAIRLDPKSAAAFVGRCVTFSNKRDYDRAIADCDEAIRLDAKYAPAYAARCLTWSNRQEPDRALPDCNEALRLDSNNVFALNARCVAWTKKRDYDRAIADCDQVIRLDPKYPAAYLNRSEAWRSKRDYDRAIADADQGIRLDPTYAVAYNMRGIARADKRDYDGAIADYNDAIRLNPKYAIGFSNRGWALRSKGEYDRAIADFSEAIKLDAKYTFAYNNRGIALMDKRDYEGAVRDFNEAVRLDPTYTAAVTNRGLAYERKGDRERARAEFNAALGLPQKYNNGKWAHDTARERLAALNPATPPSSGPTPGVPAEQRATSPARQGPPVAQPSGRGQRLALIIGNAGYPEADPPLIQPRNDARLFSDELKASGFDVELAENQTKQQLREAIERFKSKVKPGTAALLYYSGYGIQSARQNFMIPINAQIWSERDVTRDGISIESVLAEMPDHAVKLVIFDGSRRNPFERRFRSAAAGLAPIVAPANTLMISAAGLGQVINEGAGKNSLFLTELLKEFRTPVVTLEEVFNRARIGISRATDGEQVPWVSSSLMESISFKPADERRGVR